MIVSIANNYHRFIANFLNIFITKYVHTYICEAHGNTVFNYVIIVDLPAPTNVTTGVVTHDSVVVTWNPSAGATSYLISYTATDGPTLSVDVGDDTTYTLTNLMVNTSYDITVQECAGGSRKSNHSNKVSVTTGKLFITIIIS